jgi:ketosteroid isomerase-like protein
MTRNVVLGFVLVATAAFAQTAPAPARSSGKADPAIVKIADAYVKATLASDPKAVGALYTEDAVELPPNQPLIKGRAAIEQYYAKFFATGKLGAFTLDHLESTASGTVGFDVGTYKQSIAMKDGKTVTDTGKYTVIVKKVGADWKVAYAIYNSDQQPMPPPAAGPKS